VLKKTIVVYCENQNKTINKRCGEIQARTSKQGPHEVTTCLIWYWICVAVANEQLVKGKGNVYPRTGHGGPEGE
jgi:hypothetical protein